MMLRRKLNGWMASSFDEDDDDDDDDEEEDDDVNKEPCDVMIG
jgi:hypothetical protein